MTEDTTLEIYFVQVPFFINLLNLNGGPQITHLAEETHLKVKLNPIMRVI